MKKRKPTGMRPEHDVSKGVRGKDARNYAGAGIVLLDPDVARAFPDAESVNRALRAIMEIAPKRRSKKA